MSQWISFRELRSRIRFEDVFTYFNVPAVMKGGQYHCVCPLPQHVGSRSSASFSANMERGIFQCFGCGASGNLLDFAALMKGVDPKDGKALRKVACELRDRFCPDAQPARTAKATPVARQGPPTQKTVVNAPLDFELKELDSMHAFFVKQKLTQSTVSQFGIGVATRGTLKGQVAIPLRDCDGKLIGYAGRRIDERTVTPGQPKYWFPVNREREGIRYEFRKELVLYNCFRITAPVADLVIVPGFTSVWWLTQHGFPNVVSVMGVHCSTKQLEQIIGIVKPTGRVWILPNANEQGKQFANRALVAIAPLRFVKWVQLGNGKRVFDLTQAQITALFR